MRTENATLGTENINPEVIRASKLFYLLKRTTKTYLEGNTYFLSFQSMVTVYQKNKSLLKNKSLNISVGLRDFVKQIYHQAKKKKLSS